MRLSLRILTILILSLATGVSARSAVIDDAADVATQQAQEKLELEEMKGEIKDIKSTMGEAAAGMEQLRSRLAPGKIREVHLVVKEAQIEVAPQASTSALTYNGQLPGPVLRFKEGDAVRVFLHNQLKVPTSLTFHGLLLPQAVAGLPRKDGGLVNPGETFVYQFVAQRPGTYWYHPQVPQCEQMARGLYGAIVIEPSNAPKTYEKDYVLVLGQSSISPKNGTAAGAQKGQSIYCTINGKSAPSIEPLLLESGQRVRLRIINASQQSCPLFLSGHRFEVVSANGGDGLEPHVTRDTLTLQAGDRYDLEFTAGNPGVWSLSSLLPGQTSNDGKFPGGMAMVVRYKEQ